MTVPRRISPDGSTLTVRVPLTIKRRGGRKVVLAPEHPVLEPEKQLPSGTLIKAIARAHRWQRMLEDGNYATMRELAAAENISPSYISRVLQLTLTAPTLVEDILDGGHNDGQDEAQETSCCWYEQILQHGAALERP